MQPPHSATCGDHGNTGHIDCFQRATILNGWPRAAREGQRPQDERHQMVEMPALAGGRAPHESAGDGSRVDVHRGDQTLLSGFGMDASTRSPGRLVGTNRTTSQTATSSRRVSPRARCSSE